MPNIIERIIIRKEIKKMLKLSKSVHSVVQVLALILHGINFFSGLVPQEYQGLVAAVVALLQAILAIANHGDSTTVVQIAQSQENK